MKTNGHKTDQVKGHNREFLEMVCQKARIGSEQLGVLLLIADMFDEIADGKNYWMVLGATTNRSAFSLKINGADAPLPVYAADLHELNNRAAECL